MSCLIFATVVTTRVMPIIAYLVPISIINVYRVRHTEITGQLLICDISEKDL